MFSWSNPIRIVAIPFGRGRRRIMAIWLKASGCPHDLRRHLIVFDRVEDASAFTLFMTALGAVT